MPIAVAHLHVCEPVLSCSKAEHRHCSHIPEALPPMQCYSYTTTSPRTCQQLGTWQRELWIPRSGIPILNPFKNSSHTDQTLGRTLLSRMNITARPALSPQCYPITPNLNGSTFECRQPRLALVMMRVIGHTISLLRCRLRAFYFKPADTYVVLPRLWRLTINDVRSNGYRNIDLEL